MAAETARHFEALEAQAQKIMSVFIKAGYEAVAPAMIQPAEVFLDTIGESLRARTYVFTDPDGVELCLRPDLTVPACRLYLERHPEAERKAKFCYNGVAFRYQPSGATSAHPREFRQAGLEAFGLVDKEKAEAQIVAAIIEALRSAGLTDYKLRMGDLGMFRATLEAAGLPERWRHRLKHSFWRPEAFRAELQRLTAGPAPVLEGLPKALIASIDPSDPRDAERKVERYLEAEGIEAIGVRSIAEIAESLVGIALDARAEPLSRATAAFIESYVGVIAPARAAGARLKDVMREKGIDVSAALDVYHRRLQLFAEHGIDVAHAEFSAEFGRNLDYYTGFIFEVSVPSLPRTSPVAGGGRYDNLLKAAGAPHDVPAVGAAIHTERLLAAVNGGGA